jgi:hypothetical protein
MVDAPSLLAAGIGVFHMVNAVTESKQKKKISDEALVDAKERIRSARRNGLIVDHAKITGRHGHDGRRRPKDQPKTLGDMIPMLNNNNNDDSKANGGGNSIDYAVCAFVCAVLCETFSQSKLRSVSWMMITPVSLVALVTIFVALSSAPPRRP